MGCTGVKGIGIGWRIHIRTGVRGRRLGFLLDALVFLSDTLAGQGR